MRLIEIPIKHHDALIHDLIKNTVILVVIEGLQTIVLGESLFDKNFAYIALFTIIGNLLFYLLVDRYIIGAGPILSGESKIKSNK